MIREPILRLAKEKAKAEAKQSDKFNMGLKILD
jgi:hypothetical protein